MFLYLCLLTIEVQLKNVIYQANLYTIPSHSFLLTVIQTVAIELRTTPYSSILLSCLIIFTSIPPLIGFTFSTTITGFIYGFLGGIFPAVSGAFLGAMVAFALIRKYNFARFIKFSPSKQEKYMAIQEAIEQGGFKVYRTNTFSREIIHIFL